MYQVAKLVVIDNDNKYLLMYRSAHPTLGDDPDIPGGTLEDGELPLQAMAREVYEETGIVVDEARALMIYEGSYHSVDTARYSLYVVKLDNRPSVVISWEHSSYEWLDREKFLEKVMHANDTYMHMVYHTLK